MSSISYDLLKVNFVKQTEPWPAETRSKIEKKLMDLAKQLRINGEIEIRPLKDDICSSMAGLIGKASISIGIEGFKKLSDEHQEFALAHELSHIKYRDTVSKQFILAMLGVAKIALIFPFPHSLSPWYLLLPTVLGIFTKLPLSLTITLSPQMTIGTIIAVFSYSYFSKWREMSADKTALSVCSKKTKTEAWKYMKNQQEQNIADWNRMFGSHLILRIFGRIFMRANGDLRFLVDYEHPSLQTRINYLRSVASPIPQFKNA